MHQRNTKKLKNNVSLPLVFYALCVCVYVCMCVHVCVCLFYVYLLHFTPKKKSTHIVLPCFWLQSQETTKSWLLCAFLCLWEKRTLCAFISVVLTFVLFNCGLVVQLYEPLHFLSLKRVIKKYATHKKIRLQNKNTT